MSSTRIQSKRKWTRQHHWNVVAGCVESYINFWLKPIVLPQDINAKPTA